MVVRNSDWLLGHCMLGRYSSWWLGQLYVVVRYFDWLLEHF